MDTESTGAPAGNGGERRGVIGRTAAALASLPFALTLIALLVVACVIGTVLPQGDQVPKFLAKNPDAKGWIELLNFLGFTRVYSAPWFLVLLGLLALSLVVCASRRFRAARRGPSRARGRALGSMLTHISLVLVLVGGVVRGVWGVRGKLAFREGETRSEFVTADGPQGLPFAVHLAKFEIEMHGPADHADAHPRIVGQRVRAEWPARGLDWTFPAAVGVAKVLTPEGQAAGPANSFQVKILRQVPDFVVDLKTREIKSRSMLPNNPALLVEVIHNSRTNTQWLFALHPDFNMHDTGDAAPELKLRYEVKTSTPGRTSVKDYRSTLQILENETVVMEKTIEVNDPLTYRGYRFYQSGYDPRDPKWTSLQVVRDPGVPLVYTGFFLMIVGLAAVFYLYPQHRAGSASAGKE